MRQVGENATVLQGAIGGNIERPDVLVVRVVDVQNGLVRREGQTIWLLEVGDEQLNLSLGIHPVYAAVILLHFRGGFDTVRRIGEIDGPTGMGHNIVGTVQSLAFVRVGQNLFGAADVGNRNLLLPCSQARSRPARLIVRPLLLPEGSR